MIELGRAARIKPYRFIALRAALILRASARAEAAGKEGRKLLVTRATKRRTDAQKTYADAGLAKPPTGRGLGEGHIQQAIGDKPLPRKVRAKLVRAIALLLGKKGGGTVDSKVLFGEVPVKKGAWIDLVYQARWSDGDDGLIRIWQDGALVFEYHGRTSSGKASGGPYLKIGAYRSHLDRYHGGTPPPQVVYFDEYRRGGSRAAIAAGPKD